MVHFPPGFTDRDTILSDGKIIFVFYFDASFFIEIDKGLDVVPVAIKVIRHRIMGGIQNPFGDMKLRKESFHSEISFQKTMGIMFGSRIQQRKNRKVAFRVGSDKHI